MLSATIPRSVCARRWASRWVSVWHICALAAPRLSHPRELLADTASPTPRQIVLIHKWDLAKATRLIVDEGVVVAGGIPYMAMEIVEALRSEKHVLEGISWGGAPSSASLPQDVQARLGKKVAPAQGYGATEVSSMATGVSAEDYLLRTSRPSRLEPLPPRSAGFSWPRLLY